MKIKKFIFKRILSAKQREIIWTALTFSAHTYKRRGNMEGFATVTRVIDEMHPIMDIKEKTWTKEEVQILIEKSSEQISQKINEIAKNAFKKGVQAGYSEATQKRIEEETEQAKHIKEFAETLRPFGIVIGTKHREDSAGLQPGHEFSKEKCEGCDNKQDCELYNVVLKDEFKSFEEDTEKKENNTEKAEDDCEHTCIEEETEIENKHE